MRITGIENNQRIMVELGERLKDNRILMPLTQKEMAERAGVSLRTVERIENGENVKIENILNYLRALNIIQNLEVVIPEQKVMPTDIHDNGKKRSRATSAKKQKESNNEWKWGDE